MPEHVREPEIFWFDDHGSPVRGRASSPWRAAGLTAATVFELDSETGLLNPTVRLGAPGGRDLLLAGKVFRMAAAAKPYANGERMAIQLRIDGQTVGVLLLIGAGDTSVSDGVGKEVTDLQH